MGQCIGRASPPVSPKEPPTLPPVAHSSAPPSPPPEEDTGESWFSFADFFASSPTRELCGFVFEREIGKGAMSHVYLAVDVEANCPVAVKVYNSAQLYRRVLGPEEPLFESVQREINLMNEIAHRYILQILSVITSDKTNSTLLVMPFARFGTLQSLLDSNSLTPSACAICFLQIAVAFKHLHSLNIVHRDLKPDNVLCFELDYFVVSDFGISIRLSGPDVKLNDTRGSPAFLAPEECSGSSYDAKAADVWAYGITLYRAVFGYFPFNLESAHGLAVLPTIIMVKDLLTNEDLVIPELPQGTHPTVVELIRATLQKDVAKRPTFEEIVAFEYFRDAWETDEKFEREEKEAFEMAENQQAEAGSARAD
jgi:serine/threonine protein kinase